MQSARQDSSSGVSIAVIVIAVVATGIVGALAKRQSKTQNFNEPEFLPRYDFKLKPMASGSGVADVPTAPPSAKWIQYELSVNGHPTFYRPVQFRTEATDANGHRLNSEHVWSGGYYYAFIRSGFRKAHGDINLKIRYRDRVIETFNIGKVQPGNRVMTPPKKTTEWPGLNTQVVMAKGPDRKPVFAMKIDAPLKEHEAIVATRVGSTYLEAEPEMAPVFVKAGPSKPPTPMPLNVGYPEHIDAVSLALQRLRARPVSYDLNVEMRCLAESDRDRYFILMSGPRDLPGGMRVGLGRMERGIWLPINGSRSLRLVIGNFSVMANATTKLVSPGKLFGANLEINNLIRTTESKPKELPCTDQASAYPRVGDTFTIKVRVDGWAYDSIESKSVIVPAKLAEAKPVLVSGERLLPFRVPIQ